MDYFDPDLVLELLAAIENGHSLLADNHNGGFRVWTYAGEGKVGSGPHDVKWADLYAMMKVQPHAVFIHGGQRVYSSGEGFSRDSEGRISDAAFHADMLGEND